MTFQRFSLNTHINNAIQRCGFTEPTPIQQQAIPPILERRDLLGLAQTGTGKTAAFILPTVEHLMQTDASRVRMLILAPTRELAEQINEFTRSILRGSQLRCLAVYGGVSKQSQVTRLREGVDIVVACPGRLLDILNDRAIDLSGIETLILDEADQMFDKGFLPDIRRILRQVPSQRQSLVFSATMPNEIRRFVEEILTDPVTVQINPSRSIETISHLLYSVEAAQKTDLLIHLLKDVTLTSTLVFTRTKHKAKSLALKLEQAGFKAASLQGNLSQARRQQALDGFKKGNYTVLVATDIAARGIDVSGISHVINYDMPDTAEAYIHRTGRTGRACRTGEALTFATLEDGRMVRLIEQSLDERMIRQAASAMTFTRQETDGALPRRQRSEPIDITKKPARTVASATPPRRNRSAKASVFGLSRHSH
jgi:superfamily II DNA/RNA helicase